MNAIRSFKHLLGTHVSRLVLAMVATLVAAGCFEGGGSLTNLPRSEKSQVNLRVYLGALLTETSSNPGVELGKSATSSVVMRDMVVSFTSNLRDTLWDTLSLGPENDFSALDTLDGVGVDEGDADIGFSVWANVDLPPLRWWNVEVRTFDVNDSLIHHGVAGPFASRGNGESVNVSIPIINPFFMRYEARYRLPSEIFSANDDEASRITQKVFFSRLVMRIDGVVVRDTSSFDASVTSAGTRFIEADTSELRGAAGKFFFKPSVGSDIVTHIQSYAYARAGQRVVSIRAYGFLEKDSVGAGERLLYRGQQEINVVTDNTPPPLYVNLEFVGTVESENDSVPVVCGRPGCHDWTGVGLNVELGATRTVTQEIDLPGQTPF